MIDRVFLQSHALFGGINDQGIAIVMAHLKPTRYRKGDYLFRQGDEGDRLFLIVKGSVEVLSEERNAVPIRLVVRSVGDSVGEMALIDVQNRSATVRALEPVRTLSLSHHDLYRIYQLDPQLYTQIIINIAREISRRLRSMDTLLSTALYEAANCRCPRASDRDSPRQQTANQRK